MESGQLRHWLTFEQLLTETDSDGALIEEWVDAFEVSSRMPCQVIPLSGRELIAAQAVQSSVTVRIKCRYRPGFNAAQRAHNKATGVVYNLGSVIPDPESGIGWVTFNATTGLDAGGTAT